MENIIPQENIDKLYNQLNSEAKTTGYNLNPDIEFTKSLIKGLLINENRYGYGSCPCRLSFGKKDHDIDIICPCDYRDSDIIEFDACYCGLYVSENALKNPKLIHSIPERRTPKKGAILQNIQSGLIGSLPLPVWRCKVCGYLCARENPPGICPICKVSHDRFERFI